MAELADLEIALQHLTPEHLQNTSLGERRGLDAATYLSVQDAAETLCDQGRFEEACPLALYLAMHEPRHPPFCFLAASCLQRIGQFALAAAIYAQAVNNGANDAIALFRLGECLQALKATPEAKSAFEAALDSSRTHPDLWQLQDWAMSRLQTLNTSQENAHA